MARIVAPSTARALAIVSASARVATWREHRTDMPAARSRFPALGIAMRSVRWLCAVLAIAFMASVCAAEPPASAVPPSWLRYANAKYGYELWYPPHLELRVAGPEGQRDGAWIRIGPPNIASAYPALNLEVFPPPPGPAIGAAAPPPLLDHVVNTRPVTIGGMTGTLTERRFRANGLLALVTVELGDFRFIFLADPKTQAFEGSEWGQIVSSFRTLPRTNR
jgi:hypothetical protein